MVADADGRSGFTVTPESAALAPGQAAHLTVSFASGAAGLAAARLRLYTRAASGLRRTLEIGLSAEQLVAVPRLKPDTLTFPDVPLRRTSDWQSAVLANRAAGLMYEPPAAVRRFGDRAVPAAGEELVIRLNSWQRNRPRRSRARCR